ADIDRMLRPGEHGSRLDRRKHIRYGVPVATLAGETIEFARKQNLQSLRPNRQNLLYIVINNDISALVLVAKSLPSLCNLDQKRYLRFLFPVIVLETDFPLPVCLLLVSIPSISGHGAPPGIFPPGPPPAP